MTFFVMLWLDDFSKYPVRVVKSTPTGTQSIDYSVSESNLACLPACFKNQPGCSTSDIAGYTVRKVLVKDRVGHS